MVQNRRGGGNFGILMLGAQIMHYGVDNIPPATLALIAGQTAIFMGYFPRYFPSPTAVCVSSYFVYHHSDWKRMILSTFCHGSDMHLYFNMLSLLYKGSFLERHYGTPYFLYMVSVFSILTSATYVGIGVLLSNVLNDDSYLTTCAVGFSGVLFALKVLTTQYSPPGVQYAFGVIPIPNKFMFWAELLLIQLMVPNASFVGHLAGILVGLAYVMGPVKFLMGIFIPPGIPTPSTTDFIGFISPPRQSGSFLSRRGATPVESSTDRFAPRARRPHQPSPSPSAPPAHEAPGRYYRHPNHNGNNEYGDQDYHRYTGGLDEDEQYQRAMEESLRVNERSTFNQQNASSESSYDGQSYGWRPWANPEQQGRSFSSSNQRLYPDINDLRSRRSQYYQ